MYISPDPLLAFRGERGTFHKREQTQWKDTVKKIRELYFGHKFKQCAALCNDALNNKQAHPLHETFLHFYAAICQESLGLLAHNYSNNKLRFFNQARDRLTAALAALPLPHCTTLNGTYDCAEESPQISEIPPTSSSIYDPTSPTPLMQLRITNDVTGTVLETASSDKSDDGSYTSSVPSFDKYSFRQPDFKFDLPDSDNALSLYDFTFEQRQRLCQSLSIGHVVQEDLLPKPLFAKKTASVPLLPAPRALPPIPTRDHMLRKTALQTILNPSIFAVFESSPITPRFNQIRDTFDPKFSQTSRTRCLQKYNSLLSGFRTQLQQHIAAVDSKISKTTSLQVEHQMNRMSRLASFWSIKQEDVEVREKKERIDRLRKGGWNVNKRAHGWKGEEYYEQLRYMALADIGC